MNSRLLIVTVCLYALTVAVVVYGLLWARRQASVVYEQSGQQEKWDEYVDQLDDQHARREDLREEIAAGTGQQTTRKAAKTRSPRPPALELLENHFAASLITLVAFATLLFAACWGLFVGVLLRPSREYGDEPGRSGPSDRT